VDKVKFEVLCKEFDDKEKDLLGFKRAEYSDDEDVLRNFKECAAFLGVPVKRYCMALLTKHMQSINLITKKGKINWCWTMPDGTGEGLKQRIADARNYLILMAGIIDEEMENGTDKKG
jgi:hypothetical protein